MYLYNRHPGNSPFSIINLENKIYSIFILIIPATLPARSAHPGGFSIFLMHMKDYGLFIENLSLLPSRGGCLWQKWLF